MPQPAGAEARWSEPSAEPAPLNSHSLPRWLFHFPIPSHPSLHFLQGPFFSTFGGNPVSAAAAHAVLDVLDDERILPRTAAAGRALRAAVAEATARFECVGHVQGVGLANSVEMVRDRVSKEPDAAVAARVKAGMRARGVLVGTTGEHDNMMKIRPPLAFTEREVPLFVAALVSALEEATAAGSVTAPRRVAAGGSPRPLAEEPLPVQLTMLAASSRL